MKRAWILMWPLNFCYYKIVGWEEKTHKNTQKRVYALLGKLELLKLGNKVDIIHEPTSKWGRFISILIDTAIFDYPSSNCCICIDLASVMLPFSIPAKVFNLLPVKWEWQNNFKTCLTVNFQEIQSLQFTKEG